MIYRPFGNSGEIASVVGFGASPLGNVFGEVSDSLDSKLVGTAVDSGITLFDVSPYYGLGLAESRLGLALQPYRQRVLLATKCGRYGVDRFDFSHKGVVTGFEESLRRLRTDYVDLLQVHDVEFGDIDQIVKETLPALVKLRDQGKVRFIGMTSYWPGLLTHILRVFPTDMALNYCHWNFFGDDMDLKLTPTCRSLGISLLNASPLHMGLMSGGPIADWHFAPCNVREKAAQAVEMCRQYGADPGSVAIWKCLQHPTVSSTLVGLSDVQQVDQACRATSFDPPKELIGRLKQLFAPVFNVYWPQGRPENQDASFHAMVSPEGLSCDPLTDAKTERMEK